MGDVAAGDCGRPRRYERHRPLARSRHARSVQAARRVARRHLREQLRQGRRCLENRIAAPLRELRRALREGLGALARRRRSDAQPGIDGVSTRPTANRAAPAFSGNEFPAVPGCPPGNRSADRGEPVMRGILPLAIGVAVLSAPAPAFAQQSAEARLAAYTERVERLEDVDRIENLQAYFGYFFDKGLWHDATDTFAANGSFEYGRRGVYIGKDR